MTQILLQAEHLQKSFLAAEGNTVPVIRDISLTIYRGDSIALLGESGCGKTTFLHLLAGFLQPDKGTLLHDGEPIKGPDQKTGVMFQSPMLFDWLSVEDNIGFGLKRKGISEKERKERCAYYIKRVGLPGFEKAFPWELSGGMQQRVALARILILEPEILLLDEPFGALDAFTRRSMHELLIELREEFPVTTVFITHDVEEAAILAKRVLIMSARPAVLQKEIETPFSSKERLTMVDSHEFADVKHRIRSCLKQDEAHPLL